MSYKVTHLQNGTIIIDEACDMRQSLEELEKALQDSGLPMPHVHSTTFTNTKFYTMQDDLVFGVGAAQKLRNEVNACLQDWNPRTFIPRDSSSAARKGKKRMRIHRVRK